VKRRRKVATAPPTYVIEVWNGSSWTAGAELRHRDTALGIFTAELKRHPERYAGPLALRLRVRAVGTS